MTGDAGAAVAGLGVFADGRLVRQVDDGTDPYGYAALDAAHKAAPDGAQRFEVLLRCHLHPQRPAVDCGEPHLEREG